MEINKDSFKKEVLDSELPVLVDFFAPWCGPCNALAPFIEKLTVEKAGKVKIVKINTDDNPELAAKYGIMSIPTVIMFKGGKEIDKVTGFNTAKIQEMVKKEE